MKWNKIYIVLMLITSYSHGADLFDVIKPNTQVGFGRCHMGICTYSQIKSSKVLNKMANETIVQVSVLGAISKHEDAEDYPKLGTLPANIEWDSEPHQILARCSLNNPAIKMEEQVDHLDFSLLPSVLESSANLYFNICHSFFERYDLGVKKFGYVEHLRAKELSEETFNATTFFEDPNYEDHYGEIDKNGYVKISKSALGQFIEKGTISDWLGTGIRQYKPYLKTNDHWFWRVENVEYKGLHIIGIYLSVCNQSGTDRCGWGNASIGLIFEEGSDRVRKLNYAKSNKVINFNFLEKERGAVDSTAYEGI